MSDVVATPISIDMDLSEYAIDAAAKQAPTAHDILIVGTENSIIAGRLAQKYGIKKVIVIPILPLDYWCICGEYSAIYSKGA